MVQDKKLKRICENRYYYKDGALYNKEDFNRQAKKDQKAGCINNRGYFHISIEGKKYLAHRLIFLMHNGYLPKLIDHINQDPLDNRIENLRAASNKLNAINSKLYSNNKTGRTGVYWHEKSQMYYAQIRNDGKQMHLGTFDNIIDTVIARMKAEDKYQHDVK